MACKFQKNYRKIRTEVDRRQLNKIRTFYKTEPPLKNTLHLEVSKTTAETFTMTNTVRFVFFLPYSLKNYLSYYISKRKLNSQEPPMRVIRNFLPR